MKKKVRRTIVTALSIAVIAGSSLTAYAAPEVMPDGTTFDAEFYAANNPDVVAAYCDNCIYGSDTNKYYRSPYGVFVAGVYTCAGSTRALGRVLDYMGYSWQHVNENKWSHQWCIVTMDGQTGYADGMGGIAGYGEMVSGMTLADGAGDGTSRRTRPGRRQKQRRKRTKIWKPQQVFPPPSGGKGIF